MARAEKLLEKMRRNPQGDWSIGDVSTLCGGFEISCEAPKRGSHYTVADETQAEILTIPFKRPIKPIYIKRLVAFVEAVLAARQGGEE